MLGSAWELLAKPQSGGKPLLQSLLQLNRAGKRQARQVDAAAAADIVPPSAAPEGGLMSATGAAHEPSQALPAASTATSLDSVGAKRPAEAEAARSGEKRVKAAVAQQRSSATFIDYALRDLQGRDYVTVKVQQPAYLTLSHTEPVPDLVKLYNSHCSPGATVLVSTCDLLQTSGSSKKQVFYLMQVHITVACHCSGVCVPCWQSCMAT